MFAVIATGGKQYIIHEGEELKVEKLDLEEGGTIEFGAMLIADEEGTDVKVGTPNVDGAKVSATVVEQGRGKKTTVIKYKPKVRYRRKYGHRQPFTEVQITKITV